MMERGNLQRTEEEPVTPNGGVDGLWRRSL